MGIAHRIGRRFALNFANNSAGPYVHNYILLQSVESAGGDSVGFAIVVDGGDESQWQWD